MIASSPKHVGMMQDFKSMADFMRLFVLLQGGCDTPMEQPYRGPAQRMAKISEWPNSK